MRAARAVGGTGDPARRVFSSREGYETTHQAYRPKISHKVLLVVLPSLQSVCPSYRIRPKELRFLTACKRVVAAQQASCRDMNTSGFEPLI